MGVYTPALTLSVAAVQRQHASSMLPAGMQQCLLQVYLGSVPERLLVPPISRELYVLGVPPARARTRSTSQSRGAWGRHHVLHGLVRSARLHGPAQGSYRKLGEHPSARAATHAAPTGMTRAMNDRDPTVWSRTSSSMHCRAPLLSIHV